MTPEHHEPLMTNSVRETGSARNKLPDEQATKAPPTFLDAVKVVIPSLQVGKLMRSVHPFTRL